MIFWVPWWIWFVLVTVLGLATAKKAALLRGGTGLLTPSIDADGSCSRGTASTTWLSVCRFSGRPSVNGQSYVIYPGMDDAAEDSPTQPLTSQVALLAN